MSLCRHTKPVKIRDGVAYVTLTQGKVALVDERDVGRVLDESWHAVKHHSGYRVKSSNIYLHNYIVEDIPAGYTVDHINRNQLDNRKSNLRLANTTQQALNRDQQKCLGYAGIFERLDRHLPYKASVRNTGFPSKSFDNPEDAARYRDKCMVEYYTELDAKESPLVSYLDFINFNFPIKELQL